MNDSVRYFDSQDPRTGGNSLICGLCPNRCSIPLGGAGRCRVRKNNGGRGELPFQGYITAMAEDPIEKKPLYHFRPGSSVLSVGFAGCNLRCPFCQNWHISQNTDCPGAFSSPGELTEAAARRGCTELAYTYSEPLVHFEFLVAAMALARKAGIANVLVTNGCISEEPAREILDLTDAVNVDLKSFSETTYKNTLGGSLDCVLGFIRAARDLGVHTEITTLIVPDLNDSPDETGEIIDFIASLSPDIPWHLSAYHPAFNWNAPPTDPFALAEIARRAKEKLHFVYVGNLPGFDNETRCTGCGAVLVSRRGYRTEIPGLAADKLPGHKGCSCASCGKTAPIIP
ncbi:AmmeMemoRadiSam system radical SAM enzyme [Breznakiella homolactica]|uniref:AmmeMemoRadiSam system radical SAM enzyme n=1 Tax=Breznakiella homolactica TaxID=2798577 RepID=A0A7T7XL87_9SPIR|nr:AmmeMemoRadiSam system radical SAM enzyme [Breznakiella homolactica]QQO08366.1 AmmeMemoRadiSam system radical SAM enzyme [Breznakiella homolactica]